MDIGEARPPHGARLVVIDGHEHNIYRGEIPVAELFDLAGKSPDEWVVEAELQGGDRVTMSLDDRIQLHEGHTATFFMRRRDEHRHHEHEHDHGFDITVVVSSEPIKLEIRPSALLSAVVKEALQKANATGRSEDEWELKTEAGAVLDLALTVAEADVECGSTLFLSLKAGAAGDVNGELLVDPSVSTAKFEAEISGFRAIERNYSKRGIWLIRAEFPAAFLVFAAPNVPGLRLLAFGAVIDFSNYDLWAPSVRMVDPITEVPYKGGELPPQAQLLRRNNESAPAALPAPGNPGEFGRYMVWQDPGEIPFLCHAGIREYHAHPMHTGDSWLLHRGRGEGTLSRIVELLFQYGSSRMIGLQVTAAVHVPLT